MMRWRKAEIVSKREIKICSCYIVKDGDVLLPGDHVALFFSASSDPVISVRSGNSLFKKLMQLVPG